MTVDKIETFSETTTRSTTVSLERINLGIAELTQQINSLGTQIMEKSQQAALIAQSAPYVLQPTNLYSSSELASQVQIRAEYNNIIEQLQWPTNWWRTSC